MQELSTHKTQALPSDAKEVLEKLLGRRLAEDEEISIWASRPHSTPTGKAREQAWSRLNQHLDGMAAKTKGSADEMEGLVDEVCKQVRHPPR